MAEDQLMILVAGPLRGGTGDDPDLIQRNIDEMTRVALDLYQRGHLPVVGEWLSLPLIAAAGSERVGDEIYDLIQHPLAEAILRRCDGCLRIGGVSRGADQMVDAAHELGKLVWLSPDDVPTPGAGDRQRRPLRLPEPPPQGPSRPLRGSACPP
jgi:hypothetical protein